MEFLKRHCSTIVLIAIAASWIGISLGTNECPSCVVANVASKAFTSDTDSGAELSEPATKKVNWSTVDTDGQLVTSNDLDGKVSVLVYWATWCGGCKKEIPDLIALRDEFSPTDVAIIGLSFDEAHKDLDAYAKATGINYRLARITPSIIDTFGNADSIPTLMIIDQEGRIQFRHTGFVNKDTLTERVRSLLATSRIDRAFGS
ncbi:TlpA family protein disulfide reductase [Pelagicoccus mobilis]|uniref:TlpA family protein disulfide reductase n=1 Tax=Pelagicoccus mobilis TaxID=415221 RepID=A0A934RVT0_9BACT|nr:TlpA disulfide reductase family protein [Pelagicoccus mobilis]MBK1877727.1 TlpA family protein disulfide reductase [Pelagicoccus mobilis]